MPGRNQRSAWERVAAGLAALALCSACATAATPGSAPTAPAPSAVASVPSAVGSAGPGSVSALPSPIVSPVPSVSPGPPLKTVVQALPAASIGYAASYVAAQKGYFADAGLDVQASTLTGDAAVAGLVNGQVGLAAASSGLPAAMKGVPLKALLFSYDTTLFELMATPDITSVEDLQGKVIGTSARGADDEILADVFLRQAGLDPNSDVTFLVVGSGQQLPSLLAGSIQAMMLTPDLAAQARQQGMHDIVDLQTVGQALPTPFAGFVTSNTMLQNNRDTVVAWTKAYVRALQYMHDNPADAAVIIGQALQLAPSVAQDAVTDADSAINPADYGGFTEEGFNLLVQDNINQAGGAINAGATVTSATNLVDLAPLRLAQKQLGLPCSNSDYQC